MLSTGFKRKVNLKYARFIRSLSSYISVHGLFILLFLSLCFNMALYLYQDHLHWIYMRSSDGECFRHVEKENNLQRIHRILYTGENGSTVTSKEVLLAGAESEKKAFFSIGVPSIRRNGVDYLHTTIDSLLKNASNLEIENIKLVILLTDTDESVRIHRLEALQANYTSYFTNGQIQVIGIPPKGYPRLRGLTRTLGDTDDRMYWRSKQTIDFAFLMEYCRHLSPYYLQLEDDVIATKDYDIYIRDYIKEKEGIYWFNLDFSNQGFIGKLFRSETLRDLVRFLRLVYAEVPVDLTLFTYRNLLGHDVTQTTFIRNIFVHIGTKSSALT